MSPISTLLTHVPTLAEWLVNHQWSHHFGQSTMERSRSRLSARHIKNIAVSQAVEQETALITASMKGTSRFNYQVHVLFQANGGIWTLKTSCTCPVKFRCKHAAALLTLVTTGLTKSGKVGNTVHAHQLPLDLNTWLGTIERAAQASTAPPTVLPETRFLAYCIESPLYQSEQRLNFVLRVGTRLKDGTAKISQSRANADLSRPPKYMTSEDQLIIALYHQRNKKMSQWDNVPFEGPDWDDIIKAALDSGRLFYGEESYDNSNFMEDYRQMQAGPGIPVDATWKISDDGSARPILRCENSALEIIFTHPPRYLDPDTATLGFLESNLPGSLLTAWQSGPAISASNLMAVSERFSTISAAALPLPQSLETETAPKSPPLPHLRVHSRTLGSKWDTYKLVVGELSFRYADSPLLLPLAKGQVESHSQIINGKRLIWNRSQKAEQAQARRLIKVGFVALSEVISPQVLDPAALYSCVPARFDQHPEIAWIELLESAEMQALRDSGWTIEVDANAGLTTHNVTEFLPAIETHQDRDIDWFSFDISFEINGQFMSLIPIIAEGIRQDLPPADTPNLPEFITLPCENPEDGLIRFPTLRLLEIIDQTRHLFHGHFKDGPIRLDRLSAAAVADTLALDSCETIRALAKLGHCLKNITALPPAEIPASVRAELRPYQQEGYRWLQFLAAHGLHGILADDMGLGKTVQTLAHLAAECGKNPGLPSLVIAPTSVLPNWASEAEKFTPHLKVIALQGKDRAADFDKIATADVVLTSYPLLTRDFEKLGKQDWHLVALDEAQYIKNPKALSAQNAFKLKARHRVCLSGTPMENHLGELWSLMRFLMPGFLADEKTFNTQLRRPIERDHSYDAQLALNRRISPLILRRTKDQVATELPPKTEIIHGIDLTKKQTDLYESVRAAMDKRVRDAIADKGLAKSHIIVLDALLKLRQICCHPALLKTPAAQKVAESAKLNFLTTELLPTLIEEGRRILLFSTFTSMLALIEEHLKAEGIAYLKLTGQTLDRASLVKKFQTGEVPVFLISLKAGGTGLNLTAADTVIHYDPWWNPAAENQATDRAHRIGQTKPVFVHKLVCRGTIEDRILDLQKHKSALVEALLSEETSKLKIDAETLSHLLAPLD